MIGLPLHQLERRLDDRHLGRVDHERLGDDGVEPPQHLLHVADLVAADVGGAHVDDVRPLPLLLLAHLDQAVPVLLFQQLLELPRPVRVRPLADDERPGVLVQVHAREQAGHRRRRRSATAWPGCLPPTRSTTAFRCSAVVPQQPPTMLTPNSVTNRSSHSASSSGWSGKYVSSPRFCGRPALGRTLIEPVARLGSSVLTADTIRSGPTEQFSPMTSISGMARRVVTAAGTSVPGRSVVALGPVVDRHLDHERDADALLLHHLDGGDGHALRLENVEAGFDQRARPPPPRRGPTSCGR